MVSKKTGTLGGTTTDETDPPLTTMLTFDNNATTSGWRLSKTANKPRWIQDKEGNIICFPVMLMDFDRANTVQQPLGGFSIRDPTTIANRANVATVATTALSVSNFGLVSLAQVWKRGAYNQYAAMPGYYSSRTVSAINTPTALVLNYAIIGDLHSELAIHFATSAGTATLTVDASADGTNYLTLDTAAAAAAGVFNYGPTTVGGTLALSPLAFAWIRITVGTAGAGNTTTLTVSMK